MTTIVPQPPPLPPVPTPHPQVTVTVENPPPTLLQLPTGAIIDAEVIPGPNKGALELNSVFGKLSIKTSLALPENTKLDLQILRTAPQLQLIIKALNNTPLKLPATPGNLDEALKSAALKTPAPPLINKTVAPARAATILTPIKLDIGALIKTTLLRPIGNPTAAAPPPAQTAKFNAPGVLKKALQTAQNLIATKQTKQPITQQTNAKPGPEIAGQKDSPTPPPNIKSGSPTTAKTAAQLKAGTQFSMKFIGAGNASSQTAQTTTGSPQTGIPTVINGTVVATTPGGQPIMNTSLGMMVIDTKVPLLPGQSLRLEILPSQTQIPVGTSAEARFESMFTSREWPNLTDAIREIGQISPAVTQKLISTTLPQPNTQLTSNTLFFLNALKGGDMRSWIGTGAAALLDQINPDLLSQLDEDFVQLGRAATEPQAQDWRTALVPFFSGMGLEQFQMHTQGQLHEGEGGKKEEGSRFIIDVLLSRLGRIQLDGFVRTKGKRLDLIVRTEGPLPKHMRSDITKIYVDFSEAVGIAGQISFQADQKFVEISMPHLAEHPNKGIVI